MRTTSLTSPCRPKHGRTHRTWITIGGAVIGLLLGVSWISLRRRFARGKKVTRCGMRKGGGDLMLTNASILITGGTGSFGGTFVPMTLAKYNPRRLVVFSRDEMKQWEMAKLLWQ